MLCFGSNINKLLESQFLFKTNVIVRVYCETIKNIIAFKGTTKFSTPSKVQSQNGNQQRKFEKH